jgi:hypothetical protein
MRRRADCREHVLHECEVQHLLGGNVGDHLPPPSDCFELLRRKPSVLALLERERREQVLAHDPVFELSRLAEHVDERPAMLDDKRRLGFRPSAARGQHLSEAARPATLVGTVGLVISEHLPLARFVDRTAADLVVDILRCVAVAHSRKAMADVLDDSMSSQTIMLRRITDRIAPAVDPQYRHVDSGPSHRPSR